MSTRWNVHLAGWQKVAWALDEDLRWTMEALDGKATFTTLPAARVVHAAWWPAIEQIGPRALGDRFVCCYADNPPAFYVTQPGFADVAQRVNLWLARSREAVKQFETLGLPVRFAPYCADPEVFRPLPDRREIRRELGIPENAFVIGNFHRDSEAANLGSPKKQKGPDVFLEIARVLHDRVPETLVLLAGPRRHWLLRKLEERGVPFRFAGKRPVSGDDYESNIISRPNLNRLYQVLDVCVVSSRWEGGPHSILEAVLAGRPVISTPVGIARDLLPASQMYETVEAAAGILEGHARSRILLRGTAIRRKKAMQDCVLDALRKELLDVYGALPVGFASPGRALISAFHTIAGRIRSVSWPQAAPESPVRRMAEASRRGLVADGKLPLYEFEHPAGSWEALALCAARIRQCRT